MSDQSRSERNGLSLFEWLSSKGSTTPRPMDLYARARREVGRLGAGDAARLILLANDWSGYVRQAALERALEVGAPNLLPLLAARLNDHVPVIRELARTAILAQFASAPVTDLLTVLPALLKLRSATRTDHNSWLLRAMAIYASRVDPEQLREAALNGARAVSRACMDLIAARELADPAFLRVLLASSSDLMVLRGALKLIVAIDGQERAELLELAAESRLGAIRALAVPAILAGEADGAKDARAVATLLDSQARVRNAAIAYLRTGGFDMVAHYRTVATCATAPNKRRAIALAGLETLRATGELAWIRALAFDSPLLRRTALRVWIRLAPGEKDEVALAALRDHSPSVRHFAYTAVNRHGAYIPSAVVFAELDRPEDRKLLRLFAMRNRWDWLIYLGTRAQEADAGCAEFAALRADLLAWTRPFAQYDRATADQVHALGMPGSHDALRRLASGSAAVWSFVRNELTLLHIPVDR